MAQPTRLSAEILVMDCSRYPAQALSSASAARVGTDQWVSASHAFEDADQPQNTAYLIDASHSAHEIRTWRVHPTQDVALVRLPDASHGQILRLGRWRQGQAATAHATDNRRSQLQVHGIEMDGQDELSTLIQRGQDMSAPPQEIPVLKLHGRIYAGYSGGPVLDGQGRLIALSYARSTEGPPYALAVTSGVIAQMLRKSPP